MQTLDASILITSLPKMADSLNESPLNLETAVICYSLTLAIFIPVSGFVSDRFGTRNIFIFSLGIFRWALSAVLFQFRYSGSMFQE